MSIPLHRLFAAFLDPAFRCAKVRVFLVWVSLSIVGLSLGAWSAEGTEVRALDANVTLVQGAAGPEAVQADGKLLVVASVDGNTDGADGETYLTLLRFNPDGSEDSTFNADALSPRDIGLLQVLPDGSVLVTGQFGPESSDSNNDDINQPPVPEQLVKLRADGSVDARFVTGGFPFSQIDSLQPALDGKLLVSGTSWTMDGSSLEHLLRLNADGSQDPAFNVSFAADEFLSGLQIALDGKILVWLDDSSDDNDASRIVRFNADGSLDRSFQPIVPSVSETVDCFALLPNGKVLVALSASADDGTVTGHLTQFNADGQADASFSQRFQTDGEIEALFPQPNGQTLVQGMFTAVNGVTRHGLARVDADGSLDAAFDPLGDTIGAIFVSLACRPDGSVAVGYHLDGAMGATHGAVAQYDSVGNPISLSPLAQGQYVDRVSARPDGGAYADVYEGSLDRSGIAGSGVVRPLASLGEDDFAPPPAPGISVIGNHPVVSLTTIRSQSYTGSRQKGKFLLVRTGGDLSQDLIVGYTVRGSAVAGKDYQTLRGERIIKAGKTYARIKIKPVGQRYGRIKSGKATIKITLIPDPAYSVVEPASAKVKLLAKDPASTSY